LGGYEEEKEDRIGCGTIAANQESRTKNQDAKNQRRNTKKYKEEITK